MIRSYNPTPYNPDPPPSPRVISISHWGMFLKPLIFSVEETRWVGWIIVDDQR